MNYRFLGKSGLQVPELCFGAMTFTGDNGWNHLAHLGLKEAKEIIDICFDHGLTFFDTADVYSSGTSEEILGKALGPRRKEAIIATKVGFRMLPGPNGDGCSRPRILDGCDASLKRLGTDYIDLLYVHSYDPVVPLGETMEALNDLVRQGKVRYLGCSNFTAWQIMKSVMIARENGWTKFVAVQPCYNILQRDLEYELLPVCEDQGIGILPWSPLAGGFLAGKYRRNHPWPKNTRITKPGGHFPFDEELAYCVIDEIEKIACAHRATIPQVALAWLLRKRSISSLVIGARNNKQLLDNVKSFDLEIGADEWAAVDALTKPKEMYPHWHINYFRKDRLTREV